MWFKCKLSRYTVRLRIKAMVWSYLRLSFNDKFYDKGLRLTIMVKI
jgi:hypothetical protein